MKTPMKGEMIIVGGAAYKYKGEGDPTDDASWEHVPYGTKTMGESTAEELQTRGPMTRLWAGGMSAMDKLAYGAKGLFTELKPEEQQRLEAGKGATQTKMGKLGAIGTDIALKYPAYAAGGAALGLPALQAAGPLARDALLLGTAGGTGAALGALGNPGARAKGALAEGAGAMLGAGIGTMARGPFSPVSGSTADAMQKQGISLTVGQASGMRGLEDKLRGSSTTTAKRQIEAQHVWSQKEVQKTMPPAGTSVSGRPIQPPVTGKGRDAIKEGAEAFDDVYQAAYQKMGNVKLDKAAEGALDAVVWRNAAPLLKPSDATNLQDDILRVKAEFNAGDLSGRAIKDVIHSLDKPAQDAFNAGNNRLGEAYRSAQDVLKQSVTKQFPAAGKELAAIDSKYAEFLRVQKAAASPGATEGVFTPKQLVDSIRALDKSKDKRAFARGTAMPGMLAQAERANAVLGPTIPPVGPGTAEKVLYPMIAHDWKAAIPGMLGFGMYQPPVQKFMTGQYPWQAHVDPQWYASIVGALASQRK